MILKKDPKYRRLKIGGRGTFAAASYWLGADHLLVVEVANYTERYRRFYFRDIQAVQVVGTRLRLLINGIAGGIAALILVMILLSTDRGGATEGTAVAGCMMLIPGLILLLNNVMGRTCSVHIRTAVQTQKLTNLTRWKKADLLLGELIPLVQATQARPAPVATEPVPAPVTGSAAPAIQPVADEELPPEAPAPPTA